MLSGSNSVFPDSSGSEWVQAKDLAVSLGNNIGTGSYGSITACELLPPKGQKGQKVARKSIPKDEIERNGTGWQVNPT